MSFNTPEGFIPIFTAIWAGENEKAQTYFEAWKNWALEHDEGRIKRNSENVISESMKKQREKYTELMFHYMNHPAELRQIVKEEVIAHKIEKVPYQNIAGVAYRE